VLFSAANNAQVVIKEKVEVNPQSTILKSGIGGDNRNPIYLRYGGNVSVKQIRAVNSNYELWEESLGKVANVGLNGLINELGTYSQWHKFVFYIKNITSGQIYYPLISSEEIVDGSGWFEFHPSYQEGDPIPYNPDFIWDLKINIDYSLAEMPPPEILSADFITNPFQPSEDLAIPLPGNLYAVINKAVYEEDDLWIDKPYTQLVISELGYHVNDTLFFGHMNTGEVLRFFLRSLDPPVSGLNMYPIVDKIENLRQDGEIQMWRLNFEDWTDLYFDDVTIEVYIHPDSGAYAGPIAVLSNPEQIVPGDTTEITFKKRHLDGTLEDIPEWRTFEVGLLDGCELGKLSKDGVDSNYLYGVTQPIYFIADSSADSGIVKIRAGLIPEIIASSMTSSNKNESTINKKTAKRYDVIINKQENINVSTNNSSNSSVTANLDNEFCYSGTYTVDGFGEGDLNVLKPNLVFEYPKPDTILWITADPNPQMPVINCKASLNNYCKRGTIFFNWEYWIRYTLYRHEYKTNDTICRRTGMVKILGATEYEIGDPNGGGCPAESNWDVSFDYDPLLSNIQVEFRGKHDEQEGGCDAIIDQWYEGDQIFIGGDVYAKLIAKNAYGKIIAIGETSGGKILGENPSPEVFLNYIPQLDFQAVVRKETSSLREGLPRHFNFENTTLTYWNKARTYIRFVLEGWKYNPKGYPYYGVPNGYGFAQIDNLPPPSELDLWNWQTNLQSGQAKHTGNKITARNRLRRIGAPLDEKVILMNAYQMYNCGNPYWIWRTGADGKPGYWDKNPDRGINPEYAKDAYDIYLSLINQ
jgi:hypothetical protein